MEEVWKQCSINPQLWASSLGRIKSEIYWSKTSGQGVRSYQLSPTYGSWVEKNKRYTVVFRRKTYRVGRLVCDAWNGPPPFEGAVAMHLDENARNNRPLNLQWGTQKENLNFPGFINYCHSRTGDESPYRKGKSSKV